MKIHHPQRIAAVPTHKREQSHVFARPTVHLLSRTLPLRPSKKFGQGKCLLPLVYLWSVLVHAFVLSFQGIIFLSWLAEFNFRAANEGSLIEVTEMNGNRKTLTSSGRWLGRTGLEDRRTCCVEMPLLVRVSRLVATFCWLCFYRQTPVQVLLEEYSSLSNSTTCLSCRTATAGIAPIICA